MSKRSRGPGRSTHRRPGTRPPTSRPARTAPREPRTPSQLETAEIMAEEIVEERPTATPREAERSVRALGPRHRVKPGSLLAARAATEYVYIAQDMRRIVVLSVGLVGVLLMLWLVFVVLRLVPLDFY